MQAATVTKVTLLILIVILLIMIRNVFAIESQVWDWMAQYAESLTTMGPRFPC